MKKISFLLIAVFGMFILNSCSDEDFDPVVEVTSTPTISAPASGASYVLTEANAAEVFETFTWSAADFGFQAATSYAVQIDNAGNGFADALTIGSTNELTFSLTNGDMNQKLLAFGVPYGAPASMEMRVVASISDLVDQVVSETIAFTVTPYEVVIVYPSLYVPGNYQAASGYSAGDWSPDTAPEIHSIKSNDVYEGFIYLTNANSEFKFTTEPNWDFAYGDDGADGTLESDNAANIVVADPGMYKLDVDVPNLTYTVTAANFGVIGSGTPTGWDSDTDMTWDPANQVLTVTLDIAADGEGNRQIKFRANDDWAINYGDTDRNGTLVAGGENIDVPSDGNYTITLDLNGPVYRYTLTKN
ncbi:SusE domain-containing protein [Marinifilum caeruleilacunae]|uniref:SusF/SusE family outer membrane protein n=1 Tax=Marinifilum caeruleilacunae TaxID=2499076 RepID=A0ABX1WW54_9BACT|nr:SusE domain-containing protein [Marinifilum caeruleilacunae]NOU60359.1 SusF/SusE family outer membrane protein [Marinifilum caeruleilacunae]